MGNSFTSFIDVPQRIGSEPDQWRRWREQLEAELRVSLIAIVQTFDSSKMTVSVQPAIKETLLIDGVPTPVKFPIFDDVPVQIYRAGTFSITLPIQAGDECLLLFNDVCLDAWFQSGGVENVQMTRRRHDLSDAVALFGMSSNARVLSGYSADSLQIRSDDGTTFVEVKSGAVNVKASAVNLGTNPVDHLVLFEAMQTLYNAHTHSASGSGPPIPASQMTSTQSTVDTKAN